VGHVSSSGVLNVNSCIRLEKIRNNIFLARISPRHTRLPAPNGINHSSLTNLPSASRNRSGLKFSGSVQCSRSCRTLQMFTRTGVFYQNMKSLLIIWIYITHTYMLVLDRTGNCKYLSKNITDFNTVICPTKPTKLLLTAISCMARHLCYELLITKLTVA